MASLSTAALVISFICIISVAETTRIDPLLKNQHLRTMPPRVIRQTSTEKSPFVNVLDYGAIPDNQTDCTAAFQAALTAASKTNAKVVYAPQGLYVFKSSIQVPSGVTLQGTFTTVPSHDLWTHQPLDDGTILIPTGGRGDTNPESFFIQLNANAGLTGVVIYHKEQEKVNLPVPYPWSIMMVGDNPAVTDVEILNSWNGVNATNAGRHYIARVQGQPLNIGLFIDATYDIGRIEDVHFNPWYSCAQPFIMHQLLHGRAFVIGRSDWEYVFNTFAFGYAVGYNFVHTSTGDMNGNFLGIGADLMTNASVLVEASQAAGILITNGEFTAFANSQWEPKLYKNLSDSSQVVVSKANTGPVKFVNTAFWGPSSSIARIDGTGTVTFSNCQFVEWGEEPGDSKLPAIDVKNGKFIAVGNVFHQNKLSINLQPGVEQAIVSNNMLSGSEEATLNIGPKDKPKQIIVNSNSFAS